MSKVRYPETISFRTSTEVRKMLENRATAQRLTLSQYLQRVAEMVCEIKAKETQKEEPKSEGWLISQRIKELELKGDTASLKLANSLRKSRKYLD